MLRHIAISASLAFFVSTAYAAEAGKVIFASGAAQAGSQPAAEGMPVQEGDLLSTGAQGFIYVKTLDNGLFILRPNTKARIVSYRIDAANPANTRIKLELISGVARSRSGEAVKLARQNFRFNTPVAAIGVRGTDFTVFTDQDVSRVAVISGGIVVSGFSGACSPEGAGPCEGATSRELSAAQRGLSLQVQRGQGAPVLMQGGPLSPDQVAPPRSDEPIGRNGGVNNASAVVSVDPNLDAKKRESLAAVETRQPPLNAPPVVETNPVPPAPPVTPPPVTPVPVVPEQKIVWGRWQPVLDKPAVVDFTGEQQAGSQLIAVKGDFALFRRAEGRAYAVPERGSVGFALKSSEAYVSHDNPEIGITRAALDNGKLEVDFGKSTFATSFDLKTGSEVFKMRAEGAVANGGRLYGNGQFTYPTNMAVDGVLSGENGGAATYLFKGRLDNFRSAAGVTVWGR